MNAITKAHKALAHLNDTKTAAYEAAECIANDDDAIARYNNANAAYDAAKLEYEEAYNAADAAYLYAAARDAHNFANVEAAYLALPSPYEA